MPKTVTRREAAFWRFLDSIRVRTYATQRLGAATLEASKAIAKFSETVKELYKPKLSDRIKSLIVGRFRKAD